MERPILFSTEMVQAILEGRKTQTRRIVKQRIEQMNHGNSPDVFGILDPNGNWQEIEESVPATLADIHPYGKVGDILWVREKHRKLINCITREESWDYYATMPEDFHKKYPHNWKPSIHMPKVACRLKLKITNIRIEKLNTISNEDAIQEGIDFRWEYLTTPTCRMKNYLENDYWYDFTSSESFKTLWVSLYGEESWNSNPWVWAIEFERIK